MKLSTPIACSLALSVSCGLQSSFEMHTSGSSNIRYRGLPEKLTSKDRGAGSLGPEGT